MAVKSIVQASKHPWMAALLRLCSDKTFIRIKWAGRRMPYKLNLRNPRTFNEKLQWIKLYDHNPLYTTLVDKYRVKEFVTDRIGAEHVIPLLGAWDKVEDIEWDKLPDQFVIKCSHDCGGMVICKDKSKLNIKEASKTLSEAFNYNYYYKGREWPYKNVRPKIFAEAYMEDEYGELRDYKFFCFNGEVKALFIASDRQKKGEEVKFDFFDADFNHLSVTQGHPNAPQQPLKPKGFEEMKRLAAQLSKGIPEVRVDFYDVNGHVYFGEFTLFHFGGMVKFNPTEWDYTFGSWITLPEKRL
jgi:hypothetical protein